MTDSRPTDPDILALEAAYRRSRTRKRIAAVVLGAILLAIAGVLVGGLLSRGQPDAGRLERLMTESLVRLELAWFESRTVGFTEEARNATLDEFDREARRFLEEAERAAPVLREPFEALIRWMRLVRPGVPDVKAREPTAAIEALNERLAGLTPQFRVEMAPFSGVLGERQMVTAAELIVYEVLGLYCFRGSADDRPITIRVVRRVDDLPGGSEPHGHVRTNDSSVAFVLQDDATRHAARDLLPGIDAPELAFDRRFRDTREADLKAPYGKLVRAALAGLRAGSGSADAFDRMARLVARREISVRRIEEGAERLNAHVRIPDGLAWPASFLPRLWRNNGELRRAGETLAPEQDFIDLETIGRDLAEEEMARVVRNVTNLLTEAAGHHEARHVLDLRLSTPIGRCVRDSLDLREDDAGFIQDVDREARGYLAEIIEVPRAAHAVVADLMTHLYPRRGTVVFYTARTILFPLAFSPGERDGKTLAELTTRLAELDGDELRRRATGLFQECFGGYVPLRMTRAENPDGTIPEVCEGSR